MIDKSFITAKVILLAWLLNVFQTPITPNHNLKNLIRLYLCWMLNN